MPTLSPITKTQFLEAFKTCDKYLKSNYIEQEIFYYNMVYAMGMAKQYMPDKIASELEFFDDGTYRKVVVNIVKTLGPEYWRNYGNMSEQMRAEANSHFFAAGTDLAGIAIGEGVGRVAGKATRAISRPYRKTLAKMGESGGNRVKVAMNRVKSTKYLPSQVEANIHIKTRHTIWGTDILDWRKISSKDNVVEISLNPMETAANQVIGAATDIAHQAIAPGGRFSFSDTVMGDKLDVVTDFVPYVGNAKAFVSAVTNIAIGYEYSKTAKKIEELEKQGLEADRKFFNAYLFVDIEKDLNAMDKDKLYQMWRFAINQYNQQ